MVKSSKIEIILQSLVRPEAIISPKENPPGEDGYWYHATYGRYLRRIRKVGLVVGDGRNWPDLSLKRLSMGRIWFAASPVEAHAFANQRQQRIIHIIALPEFAWADWSRLQYLGQGLLDRVLGSLEGPVRRVLAKIHPRFEVAVLLGAVWSGGICMLRVRQDLLEGQEKDRKNDDGYQTVAIKSALSSSLIEVWDSRGRCWRPMRLAFAEEKL